MIVPSPGDNCQACQAPATSFHPYIGFCCATHLAAAQQAYNSTDAANKWEEFSRSLEHVKELVRIASNK